MNITKDKKMIYLATAYSYHSNCKLWNKVVMWWRYHKVSKFAAKLMKKGYVVFSPISHSHVIAVKGNMDQLNHDLGLSQDWWYVKNCDELHVLRQGKNFMSTGVVREVTWALDRDIPIVYHNYNK